MLRLSAKILGCSIQLVTTTALAQKTVVENAGSSLNSSWVSTNSTGPLILYASDSNRSSLDQTWLPSAVSRHSLLFVVLGGASAFSIIILAFLIIYRRRYQSRKLASSARFSPSLSPSTPPPYPHHPHHHHHHHHLRLNGSVKKSQIRHITHDEQKERYRSLFGVPAGYLRARSTSSLNLIVPSPPPPPPPAAVITSRYSNSCFQADLQPRSWSSIEMEASHLTELDRKSRLVSFEEGESFINNPAKGLDEDRLGRLPNKLVAGLKSIKDKTKSNHHQWIYRPQIQASKDFPSILVKTGGELEVDDDQEPRSPSILATPPDYYIKTSVGSSEKSLMKMVNDRLEREISIQSSNRGDSFFWKSPPKGSDE